MIPKGRTPRLNDPVHYVSYGTPGGEYSSVCRAAVVTGVLPISEGTRQLAEVEAWDYIPYEAHLFVMNPTGSFFNQCLQDEANRRGGTWHFPCEEA
jgi:hypothetical protein